METPWTVRADPEIRERRIKRARTRRIGRQFPVSTRELAAIAAAATDVPVTKLPTAYLAGAYAVLDRAYAALDRLIPPGRSRRYRGLD